MRGGKYHISGQLGHYGKLRQGYVEQFCPGTYRLLCMKNRVQEHYAYVDQAAFLVYWRLFEDFSERIGLTEDLHARDPEEWARRWNHCHHRADEIVKKTFITTPFLHPAYHGKQELLLYDGRGECDAGGSGTAHPGAGD